MSITSFENYAAIAQTLTVKDTEIAGRYEFQAAAERLIVPDVLRKLDICNEDSLIEIGCGTGNLLIPLSYFVAQASGLDNFGVIGRLKSRIGGASQMCLYEGDFLTTSIPLTSFSKVLIYSVIHYLEDESAVIAFVDKALQLIKPGGRLLIGDVPNLDKKKRFSETKRGIALSKQWQNQVHAAGPHPMSLLPRDTSLVKITDRLIVGLIEHGRSKGFESYVLSQPPELPFGNTREDLLFIANDYE
jgi:SAM-dependent methyltransferase